MKNYKISISKTKYGYLVNLYNLMIRPVYEPGVAEPVRHDHEWIKSNTIIQSDWYLGARIAAWVLKYKIETGGLLPGGEKTIYERKG